MSVKKSKKARRRRQEKLNARRNACDRHHIFYQKSQWRGIAKELRLFAYCKLYIPKNTLHRQIHEEVPTIPVPKAINVKEALMHLRLLTKQGAISEKDNLERRLIVLVALFDCAEPETTAALKKQLEIVQKFNKKPR